MPVILDAMGGDHAPLEIVKGALGAAQEFGLEIVLVGKSTELSKYSINNPHISVVHAESVVGMSEHAARALRRKPDASVRVACAEARKHAPSSAVVSAGHTGAVMAASLLEWGRIPGIDRPAIAATFPTVKGDTILLDAGANVECKPHHLVQFAIMGSLYAEHVLEIQSPSVGLLSNGTEDTKGTESIREAYHLLSERQPVNFVGNIEGGDVFGGDVHVVVTSGFVGNVLLKAAEGLSHTFQAILKEELASVSVEGTGFKPLFKRLERFRPSSPANSGAPLLGVEGPAIISHGASRAETIKNALMLAHRFAESGTLEYIKKACNETGAAGQ